MKSTTKKNAVNGLFLAVMFAICGLCSFLLIGNVKAEGPEVELDSSLFVDSNGLGVAKGTEEYDTETSSSGVEYGQFARSGAVIEYAQGSSAKYSKEIDISDNSKTDTLVELYGYSCAAAGTADANMQETRIVIRFSEKSNPSNYFDVIVSDCNSNWGYVAAKGSTQSGQIALRKNSSNNWDKGGVRDDEYSTADITTAGWGLYYRRSLAGYNNLTVKITYDKTTNMVYAYENIGSSTAGESLCVIRDFNVNRNDLSTWAGFSTDKIEMTIIGDNGFGSLVVQNVDGQSLAYTKVVEKTSTIGPNAIVDANGLAIAKAATDYPAFDKKGVVLDYKHGENYKINKVVDISDNTKDDLLLSINGVAKGETEVNVDIKFAEKANPKNYFIIKLDSSTDTGANARTLMAAWASGQTQCGYNVSTAATNNVNRIYPTTTATDPVLNAWSIPYGLVLSGYNNNAFRFYYDNETMCLYYTGYSAGVETLCLLRDFSKTHDGYGNAWTGFTTDEIEISINPVEKLNDDFIFGDGTLVINCVDGESFAYTDAEVFATPTHQGSKTIVDANGLAYGKGTTGYTSYANQGVVLNYKAGETYKLNRAIDITNNTMNDLLFSFNGLEKTADEAGLEFKFAEKANPTNYFVVKLNSSIDTGANARSLLAAYASGQTQCGYNISSTTNNQHRIFPISMPADPVELAWSIPYNLVLSGYNTNAFRFFYDFDTNCLYYIGLFAGYEENICLLRDFNKEGTYGSAWGGFNDKEIEVTISCVLGEGSLVLNAVDGVSLAYTNSQTFEENGNFYPQNQTINTVESQEVTIPNLAAKNFVTGADFDTSSLTTYVKVGTTELGEWTSTLKYTPTTAGDYVLEYYADNSYEVLLAQATLTVEEAGYIIVDGSKVSGNASGKAVLPSASGTGIFVGYVTDNKLYKVGSTVDADESEYVSIFVDFAMVNGASIRLVEDSNGLRFTTTIVKEDYDLIASYVEEVGTLILPTDKIKAGGINLENYTAGTEILAIKKVAWYDDEATTLTFSSAIVNILDQNIGRKFSARSYITLNYEDGTQATIYTNYDENNNSRSILDVATAALASDDEYTPEQELVLQGIVDRVIVVDDSFDKATYNTISSNLDIVKTVGATSVTLEVTTESEIDLSKIRSLIVDGVRVNNAVFSYDGASQKLTVSFDLA